MLVAETKICNNSNPITFVSTPKPAYLTVTIIDDN